MRFAILTLFLGIGSALHAATIGQQCVKLDIGNASQEMAWAATDAQGKKWICARVHHDIRPGGAWTAMLLPQDVSSRTSQDFPSADAAAAWLTAQPFASASRLGE